MQKLPDLPDDDLIGVNFNRTSSATEFEGTITLVTSCTVAD